NAGQISPSRTWSRPCRNLRAVNAHAGRCQTLSRDKTSQFCSSKGDQMEFMPEHAPMVVMAFLGTLALLGVLALILVFAIWARKKWIGIGTVAFGLALVCGYALVLVGVSLASHEKLLAPGERKYFCEIDCHIAYSIAGVEEGSTLGNELRPTGTDGRFVIV